MRDDRPTQHTRLSRFMALILRHQAHRFGVRLDAQGYADIDELLRAIQSSPHWRQTTRDDILEVVRQQEKQRFEVRGDRIRARYGHSLQQRIEYAEVDPPEYLYHGTSPVSLERIRVEGLLPMERQYIHLSATVEDAIEVGRRRSREPVILRIHAREAQHSGIRFYQAEERIYLVKKMPREFIEETGRNSLRESPPDQSSEASRHSNSDG